MSLSSRVAQESWRVCAILVVIVSLSSIADHLCIEPFLQRRSWRLRD